MPEADNRNRDLILAPNQFTWVLDTTKGHIVCYVGPSRTSLSQTDFPVTINPVTGQYVQHTHLADAIQPFVSATEGDYAVLLNPSKDATWPEPGRVSNARDLGWGEKRNIPGPVTFPLWPGQVAEVVPGHQLRTNQWVLARVYSATQAKAQAATAVMQAAATTQPTGDPETDKDREKDKEKTGVDKTSQSVDPLAAVRTGATVGQLIVVRGVDVAFFIPPSGIEVVPDGNAYVRDAVTLERLEYAVLVSENGNKRYEIGPKVVFPEPTEVFLRRDEQVKFRAIELNENMGIHIKVVAPYTDGDVVHAEGEELFITGREQRIYFPREEHAIVRYGDGDRARTLHFGVAIPAGEGRYVLNKITGEVTLEVGPQMFLADPRNEVIVRRVLTEKQVDLWYPNNETAQLHNESLRQIAEAAVSRGAGSSQMYLSADPYATKGLTATRSAGPSMMAYAAAAAAPAAAPSVPGAGHRDRAFDTVGRSDSYTPPRIITLDTKFDGAATIDVWTGYAVQVVSKTGSRRVAVGPTTVLLEYDETLEVLSMSTGLPKGSGVPLRTVYLRVNNNRVHDKVVVETKDLVQVEVDVAYRVNFEGDQRAWFGVEDYVSLLTDHHRSMLRGAAKRMGVEALLGDAAGFVRDAILGKAPDAATPRPGRTFGENGMHVYDVEILGAMVTDQTIRESLVKAQREVVTSALALSARQRTVNVRKQMEQLAREEADAVDATAAHQAELRTSVIEREKSLELAAIESRLEQDRQKTDAEKELAGLASEVERLVIERATLRSDYDSRVSDEIQARELRRLDAEIRAVVEKAKAWGPEVVAALQSFADKDLAGKLAGSMGPLAIIGGTSILDVAKKLLEGTPLQAALDTYHAAGTRRLGT